MAARKKNCAPDYDTLTRDKDGDLIRRHARGTFKASNCCGALPIVIGDDELVCRRCFCRLHPRFMSKAVNIKPNYNKENIDMADTDTTPAPAPAPKRPVRKPVTKPKFDRETITKVADPEPTPAPAPKRAPRKPAAKPAGGPVDPGHKPATSKGATKPAPIRKPTAVKPRPKPAAPAPAADSTILFVIKAGKDYVAPIADDDEVYLMPSLRDAQTFTTAAAATRWANSKRVTRLDGKPTDLVKVTKPAGRGRPSTTVVKPLS